MIYIYRNVLSKIKHKIQLSFFEVSSFTDKGNSNSKEPDRTGECSTIEFMVDNGPASREMSKSKELDVSDDKVSGVEDLDCPKLPSLPEPEIKQGIHHQVLPSDRGDNIE